MNLANLLDQTIHLTPETRHTVRSVMRWAGAAAGLLLLGWVMFNAEHLTVRKAAKTAKQEAQTAVDRTANFARIIFDKDGQIVSWNRGASETTGWRADEMIGKNIAQLIAPQDKDQIAALLSGDVDGRNMLLRRAGSKSATVLVKVNAYAAADFRYVTARPIGHANGL